MINQTSIVAPFLGPFSLTHQGQSARGEGPNSSMLTSFSRKMQDDKPDHMCHHHALQMPSEFIYHGPATPASSSQCQGCSFQNSHTRNGFYKLEERCFMLLPLHNYPLLLTISYQISSSSSYVGVSVKV